jgi:hypothetical protein
MEDSLLFFWGGGEVAIYFKAGFLL